MRMGDRAFGACVTAALAQVPAAFRPYLEGVAVVVEDWPSEAVLEALGVPPDEGLYGLYTGRALTEGPPEPGELPPCITLYREPLLEDCRDAAELQREITRTVLHEVGHHLGLDEARLAELGWD